MPEAVADEARVNQTALRLIKDDLTDLDVDAFVFYAANDLAQEGGTGTLAALATLVYGPAKIVYATGGVLFVGCAVGQVRIEKAVRTIWPFYAAILVALMIITFVPSMSLTLPGLLNN